jgi:hypothetical protein
MSWFTLERVWRTAGGRKAIKVRFCDWTHQIKYFVIMGESADGKRFIGKLDSGEKMSFSKRSRGWSLYYPEAELQARAV